MSNPKKPDGFKDWQEWAKTQKNPTLFKTPEGYRKWEHFVQQQGHAPKAKQTHPQQETPKNREWLVKEAKLGAIKEPENPNNPPSAQSQDNPFQRRVQEQPVQVNQETAKVSPEPIAGNKTDTETARKNASAAWKEITSKHPRTSPPSQSTSKGHEPPVRGD